VTASGEEMKCRRVVIVLYRSFQIFQEPRPAAPPRRSRLTSSITDIAARAAAGASPSLELVSVYQKLYTSDTNLFTGFLEFCSCSTAIGDTVLARNSSAELPSFSMAERRPTSDDDVAGELQLHDVPTTPTVNHAYRYDPVLNSPRSRRAAAAQRPLASAAFDDEGCVQLRLPILQVRRLFSLFANSFIVCQHVANFETD
jgi:hypothetical protein